MGIWSVELRRVDPAEISERAAELDELGFGTCGSRAWAAAASSATANTP